MKGSGVQPTCNEVAFEQWSHRKEEQHLGVKEAPADPKEPPRDLRRKKGAEKCRNPPEEQKVILPIPEMNALKALYY